MEAIQTSRDHRSYLEENELLFDTLKIIWNNYMQETLSDGGDVDIKVFIYLFYNLYGKSMFFINVYFFQQHWLQLFLYNFQFVSKELLENETFKM